MTDSVRFPYMFNDGDIADAYGKPGSVVLMQDADEDAIFVILDNGGYRFLYGSNVNYWNDGDYVVDLYPLTPTEQVMRAPVEAPAEWSWAWIKVNGNSTVAQVRKPEGEPWVYRFGVQGQGISTHPQGGGSARILRLLPDLDTIID